VAPSSSDGQLALVGFRGAGVNHFFHGSLRIPGLKIHTPSRIFEQDNFKSLSETIQYGVLNTIVRRQTSHPNALNASLSQQIA
jgi:hypothetical protein